MPSPGRNSQQVLQCLALTSSLSPAVQQVRAAFTGAQKANFSAAAAKANGYFNVNDREIRVSGEDAIELIWVEEIRIPPGSPRITINGTTLSPKMNAEIDTNLERVYKENPAYSDKLDSETYRGIDVKTAKMDFVVPCGHLPSGVPNLRPGLLALKRCVRALEHDLEMLHVCDVPGKKDGQHSFSMVPVLQAGEPMGNYSAESFDNMMSDPKAVYTHLTVSQVEKFKLKKVKIPTESVVDFDRDPLPFLNFFSEHPGYKEFRSWLVTDDDRITSGGLPKSEIEAIGVSEKDPPNSLNTHFFQTVDKELSEIHWGASAFLRSELLQQCRPMLKEGDPPTLLGEVAAGFPSMTHADSMKVSLQTAAEFHAGALQKGLTARSFLKKIWRGVFKAGVDFVQKYEITERHKLREKCTTLLACKEVKRPLTSALWIKDVFIPRLEPVSASKKGRISDVISSKMSKALSKTNLNSLQSDTDFSPSHSKCLILASKDEALRAIYDGLTSCDHLALKLKLRRMEIQLKRSLFGVTVFNSMTLPAAVMAQPKVLQHPRNTSELKTELVGNDCNRIFAVDSAYAEKFLLRDGIYKILNDWFTNYAVTDFQNVLIFEDKLLNGAVDSAVDLLERTCWLEYCDFQDGLTPLLIKKYNTLAAKCYVTFREELKRGATVADILASFEEGSLDVLEQKASSPEAGGPRVGQGVPVILTGDDIEYKTSKSEDIYSSKFNKTTKAQTSGAPCSPVHDEISPMGTPASDPDSEELSKPITCLSVLQNASLPPPAELLELLDWFYKNTDLSADPYGAKLGEEGHKKVEKYFCVFESKVVVDSKAFAEFCKTPFAWVSAVLLGEKGNEDKRFPTGTDSKLPKGLVERIEECWEENAEKFSEEEGEVWKQQLEELREVEREGKSIREKGLEAFEALESEVFGGKKGSDKDEDSDSSNSNGSESNGGGPGSDSKGSDSKGTSKGASTGGGKSDDKSGAGTSEFTDPPSAAGSTVGGQSQGATGGPGTGGVVAVSEPISAAQPAGGRADEKVKEPKTRSPPEDDDDEDGENGKKSKKRTGGGGGSKKPEPKPNDGNAAGPGKKEASSCGLVITGVVLIVFFLMLAAVGGYLVCGGKSKDGSESGAESSDTEFDIETGLHPKSLGALERAGLNSETGSNPGSGITNITTLSGSETQNPSVVVTSGQGETVLVVHSGSSHGPGPQSALDSRLDSHRSNPLQSKKTDSQVGSNLSNKSSLDANVKQVPSLEIHSAATQQSLRRSELDQHILESKAFEMGSGNRGPTLLGQESEPNSNTNSSAIDGGGSTSNSNKPESDSMPPGSGSAIVVEETVM